MGIKATRGEIAPESIPPKCTWTALNELLRADDFAREVACDAWEFAVEIRGLVKEGLDLTHLRWLVRKGYFLHAIETTRSGDEKRSFVSQPALKFSKGSCFVITEAGAAHVRHLQQRLASEPALVPAFDVSRHQLWLGEALVKEFKLPSPNQETILAAFQEEGWPPKIDDPLPPHPDMSPKRRLHDAIKGLNRNQKAKLTRFGGDGTGEAIRWELCNGHSEKSCSDESTNNANGK